jgi:exodeoxyribonuclease V beta subunit
VTYLRPHDNLTVELSGHNLVEASAGTGKTFAIACLYLRLVVEGEGLLPDNILVVTFTEAATKELRARIRQRLRQARDRFAGGGAPDEFLDQLAVGERWPGHATALSRIDSALQTFDCAAISTIHGFCLRALQENAFESGSLFDTELAVDQEPLLRQVADDFWRRHFFGADAPLLPLALGQRWSPEVLATFLRNIAGKPHLAVEPVWHPGEVDRVAGEIRDAFAALSSLWRTQREEVAAILAADPGLSRSKSNYHPDLVPGLLAAMDGYAAGADPYALFAGFDKFTAGFLAGQRLKKADPPRHDCFDLCDRLARLTSQRLLLLKAEFAALGRERLAALKAQRNVRGYDDLLTDLHAALDGPGGAALADRLRERYRAALIDEFQDTDQVQYRIFRAVFSGGAVPLFLIGDPKQAIYSFRGADVFAYLEARQEIPAERCFTMDRNWRSTPEMVDAVSSLFRMGGEHPFLAGDIAFPPVTAARRQGCSFGDRDPAPLQLWFIRRGEGDRDCINLGTGRQRIVTAVADEISGLLADGRDGTACLEDEDGRMQPLTPGDVAVIVRSHFEAGLVQQALRERGIPSVVQSADSLFETREAGEVWTVMGAVAEPGNEGRVRAALVTALFGLNGNDLALLMEQEAAWEERIAAFRDYRDLWRERGFMTMFRALLDREGVRERCLPLPDGERRLTNLRHCAEVLHQAAVERRLGPDALTAWFGERVSVPPPGEDYQIRLESDDRAVRIVTVHVSKGLEYPVVFAPFMWGGLRDDGDLTLCHEEGYRLVADFGTDRRDERQRRARTEALAENLRLLYVALTRARCRAYLVWGKFRGAETSAPGWLLHGSRPDGGGDPVALLEGTLKKATDQTLLERLDHLATASGGGIAVTEDPCPDRLPRFRPAMGEAPLVCRDFRGDIDAGWRVASFTSFASGHRETAELPDRDQTPPELPPDAASDTAAPPEGSMFAFPRGSRAGIFLHGLFEQLDFAVAGDDTVRDLVRRELERNGHGAQWLDPVSRMVGNVLNVPLGGEGNSFRLADLAPGSWLAELEFYFPLRFVRDAQVATILAGAGVLPQGADLGAVARRIAFGEARGMVRGFVDLVFRHSGRYYLIDWKSNHLGNRAEDYAAERLCREMERSLYPLQYLLYTVALNRFLERRLPGYRYEEHFGGVFYLFLRGIDPERPALGVYHDLPRPDLVRALTDCLAGREGGAP